LHDFIINYHQVKIRHFIFVLILTTLICFSNTAFSQHRILLLNGKEIFGKVTDTSKPEIEYQFTKKNGKVLERFIEKSRVFSITDTITNQERIIYQKDTETDYSVEEMRYYIKGEQDAAKGYKARTTFAVGFVTAFGVVAADSYGKVRNSQGEILEGFYHREPGIINIAYPMVFTLLSSIPKVKVNVNKLDDKSYLNHTAYLDGYERVARSKKIFSGLKGSALGIASGIATYFILRPELD
jgi:hypothetical protein